MHKHPILDKYALSVFLTSVAYFSSKCESISVGYCSRSHIFNAEIFCSSIWLFCLLFVVFISNHWSNIDSFSYSDHSCLCHLVLCRFSSLPSVIYQFQRLEILVANDNRISDIDAESLCGMPMIATLALQNNNISSIPPQLGNCTQLRSVVGPSCSDIWLEQLYILYVCCSA